MTRVDSNRIPLETYENFNDNYMLYQEYDDLISEIEQMEDVKSYTIVTSIDKIFCNRTDTWYYYGIIHAYVTL